MKPELLAPAGSIECFHAALEAGADAVYLGLTDFNARLRARNFTAKTLSCLVPYAHQRGARVYVALNTLIKQAELEPVVHALYQLDQLGADALIVADPGLIDIARKHFPRLRLHASTQMAVHNSAGVRAAARRGLARAVLSRELTMDEIAAVSSAAAVELEVFVHGALCYCISGLCLASSFLGGSSGNRGRCTQVCRRKFEADGARGYFFSPGDFSAAGFLPRLAALRIASLKIEGRMKSAAYVHSVVGAYRKALDGEISLEKAAELLTQDLAREKTTLFLGGMRQSGVIDPEAPPGTGGFAGRVAEAANGALTLDATRALAAGDRVRIQPESGFEGAASAIRSVSLEGGRTRLLLTTPVACAAGDAVFLVGRGSDNVRFDRRGTGGAERRPYQTRCRSVQKILAGARAPALPAARRDVLWIKIDAAGWTGLLRDTPCQRLIFAGSRAETETLLDDQASRTIWKSRLLVAPPPFIPERETGAWRSLIDRCVKAGIAGGACSNIGHEMMFPRGAPLIADAPLGCLNRASAAALAGRGFTAFVHPYEDDYLNIKAAISGRGIVCLFSRVPLFISRVKPAVSAGAEISDPHGNRFDTAEANGLFYLLSKSPFCVTHRRRKLSAAGVRDFLLDLSFCPPDPRFLADLLGCYRNGTRLPGASLFNFKAGLK